MDPTKPDGGPLQLLILQPTPFCNLDCDYCYLPNRTNKGLMSELVLRKTIERTFESRFLDSELTVVWHAGEPLSVPKSFYGKASNAIKELNSNGCRVVQSVQSNGTLIDDEWCKLFKEHDFRVGISIDGPQFIHDKHRKRRSGSGTFESVMAGIRRLREHDVEFYVIAVITQDALAFPDEIFAFFRDLGGRRVGLNFEEQEGANKSSSLNGVAMKSPLRQFVKRLFELWTANNHQPRIREFEGLIGALREWNSDSDFGRDEGKPFTIVSVDFKGDFSTFSPELHGHLTPTGPFIFGNVLRDSFESCMDNAKFKKILQEINAGIEQCRQSCPHFCLCGGGNPSNKFFENGRFDCTETNHCIVSKKIIIEETFAVLEQVLGITS